MSILTYNSCHKDRKRIRGSASKTFKWYGLSDKCFFLILALHN